MHFEFSYCYLKYTSFVQYIHNKFCLENLFFWCIVFALKSVLVYWTTNSRGLIHVPTSIKGTHPCTHINQENSSMHTHQSSELIHAHQSRELIHAHISIKGAHPCTHINQGSSSMHTHQCIRNTNVVSAAAEIQPKWSTRPFSSVVQYIYSAGVVACLKPYCTLLYSGEWIQENSFCNYKNPMTENYILLISEVLLPNSW